MCKNQKFRLAQFYGIRDNFVVFWITFGRVSFALELWNVVIEVLNSSNDVPPTNRSYTQKASPEESREMALKKVSETWISSPTRQMFFWADQKAERHVKERQEASYSEGSPMASHTAVECEGKFSAGFQQFRQSGCDPSIRKLIRIEYSQSSEATAKHSKMQTHGRRKTGLNLPARHAPGNQLHSGQTTLDQDVKSLNLSIASHPSRSLSLLSVPFVPFLSFFSSSAASSSLPSASTTSVAGVVAKAQVRPLGGVSLSEWLTFSKHRWAQARYMDPEHTPINIPDIHHNFLCPDDATVILPPEGLPHPGASSSNKHCASRVPPVFGSLGNGLWKQMADFDSVHGRSGLQEICANLDRGAAAATIFSSQSIGKRGRQHRAFAERENHQMIRERKVGLAVGRERVLEEKIF